MVQCYFLGPFRLAQEGRPLAFRALPRTLPLLTYLVVHRDRELARAQLAFTLWPDVREAEARANLRRHLHALESAFPPAPGSPSWVLADARTVRWNPEAAAWLDLVAFEAAAATPQGAAEAVRLYGGELVPEVDDLWLQPERERLRQLYLAALASLVDHHRSAGELDLALGYAERLACAEPLREDTARQLMALRLAAGDRAGAVQAYHGLRRALADELDLAPSPATEALLAEATRPGSSAPRQAMVDLGPSAPAIGETGRVPAAVTALIGREEELAQLVELVAEAGPAGRLITLTGPGGAGKTRLAQAVAWHFLEAGAGRFADGVVHVPLEGVAEPDWVAPAIAEALGLEPAGPRPVLRLLIEALEGKELLLAVDNFEQVLAAAPLLGQLLAAAPGLSLLVTSRAPLGLAGEHEFPVRPLAAPPLEARPDLDALAAYPAVALFQARARAVQPDFRLTPANAADVASLCSRLDGLPLAIELAAGHTKLLSPHDMLSQFSALPFVSGDRPYRQHGGPERHQTLRRTVDWSFDLLAPEEKALFCRLGVFGGTFHLAAVAAVAGGAEDDAARLGHPLAVLVDHNLVMAAPAGVGGRARFRLLSTLRDDARERLAARGELGEVRARLARYGAELVAQAEAGLLGPEPLPWLLRLDEAHEDLRSTLTWCLEAGEAAMGLAVATRLEAYWLARGHLAEGRRWLAALLDLPGAETTPMRIAGLRVAGLFAARQGDREEARTLLDSALALARAAGDAEGTARMLVARGVVEPDDRRRQAELDEALATFRAAGDQLGIASALQGYGLLTFYAGDFPAARAYWEQCLVLRRALGHQLGIDHLLNNLGLLELEMGDPIAARERNVEALAIRRALGTKTGLAQSLLNLAVVTAKLGDDATAGDLERQSLRLHWELGSKVGIVECFEWLAELAARQGPPERAVTLYAAASALRSAVGLPPDRIYGEIHALALREAEAQLSPAAAVAAWSTGATLRLDAAVRLGLG